MRFLGFLVVFAEALLAIALVAAFTHMSVSLGATLGGAAVVGIISDAVYLYTAE